MTVLHQQVELSAVELDEMMMLHARVGMLQQQKQEREAKRG